MGLAVYSPMEQDKARSGYFAFYKSCEKLEMKVVKRPPDGSEKRIAVGHDEESTTFDLYLHELSPNPVFHQ